MRPVVWLVLLAFPPAFVAIWTSVTFLTGALGGWRGLAQAYADTTPWRGPVLTGRNAWMGLWGYGWSVNVGADARSLHLSVMAPFRVGHPPLRIPLDDVQVSEEPWILGRRAVYRFRRAPRVRFRTSLDLAWTLREMSGGRLRTPGEPTAPAASGPRSTTPPQSR